MTLALLTLTGCFKTTVSDSRELTLQANLPTVREYNPDTQNALRAELQTVGCLPVNGVVKGCTMPTAYRMLIDYFLMREETRAASPQR